MAKSRNDALDTLIEEPAVPSSNGTATNQEDRLTPDEKELYNRCFEVGITSIISTITNLGGVRNKQEFVRSLLRENFRMCDLMVEEFRKYRSMIQ